MFSYSFCYASWSHIKANLYIVGRRSEALEEPGDLIELFTLRHINVLFNLLFSFFQVKPLIWVESVIERHAHSRVEYMVKVSRINLKCPILVISSVSY